MSLVLGEQGKLERGFLYEELVLTCEFNIGERPSPRAAVRLVLPEKRSLRIESVTYVAKSRTPWGGGVGRDP